MGGRGLGRICSVEQVRFGLVIACEQDRLRSEQISEGSHVYIESLQNRRSALAAYGVDGSSTMRPEYVTARRVLHTKGIR
ncbi:hypothetical protein GCM10022238_16970 [Gordonia hankookensis]